MSPKEGVFWGQAPKIGQDEKTLKEYDLDHKTIIAAAERVQRTANKFRPRSVDGIGALLDDMLEDPEGRDQDDFLYFNVPVCDLDKVKDIEGGFCDKPTSGCHYDYNVRASIVTFVTRHCASLELGGEKWPYHDWGFTG